ncbi:MAG: hypothetical protein WBG71_12270 [Leeuwenhoekiella sp.]
MDRIISIIILVLFQLSNVSSFGQDSAELESTKERLFIKLDTMYFNKSVSDPHLYFLKNLTPSTGIFFKTISSSLKEEHNKIWDLEKFVAPLQFYSKDRRIITKMPQFMNYLNEHYIVYLVDYDADKFYYYKVSFGFMIE